ncbi:hypothetical protein EAX61_04475 [Dokdonia sinensis]|uniref:DUF3278 domain-containing protein n=1 Tax=Dokdonia sinensis TaxID=2479847 RepID=A0A3M0GJN0_9FLAO|nr:hypothetical protein [Dokdonia sinensis]RMB62842.1 hypothetical protein EAX61_04475 [Dokdonia sinensis]
MELEEMQIAWSQMSSELEKQKQLTDELIMKMAQQQYTSKINKILRAERVGAIICFATIIYILVNFTKFQSWQSQASAVILVITLFVMSVGSLFLLKKMKAINLQQDNLSTTIKKFSKYKKYTSQFQRGSILVGFFVLFASSAVFSVLFSGKDMFLEVDLTKMIIPMIFGLIIFGIIAYLGSRFYGKSLKEAQLIIEDLED